MPRSRNDPQLIEWLKTVAYIDEWFADGFREGTNLRTFRYKGNHHHSCGTQLVTTDARIGSKRIEMILVCYDCRLIFRTGLRSYCGTVSGKRRNRSGYGSIGEYEMVERAISIYNHN